MDIVTDLSLDTDLSNFSVFMAATQVIDWAGKLGGSGSHVTSPIWVSLVRL